MVRVTSHTKSGESVGVGDARPWRKLRMMVAVIGVGLIAEPIVSAGVRQYRVIAAERLTVEAEMAQEPYRDSDWGRAASHGSR